MEEKDPILRFQKMLARMERKDIPLPNAMALATVSKNGKPSLRMMLLKGVDARGFIFYTNLGSRKAKELLENPSASICFWWPLDEQVRVEGKIVSIDGTEADTYFATRPRGSQLGAWASKQSEILKSRKELLDEVEKFKKKFQGKPVPRPPFWSGFLLAPERLEFWHGRTDRLHDRTVYIREENSWKIELLYP